MFPFPYVAHLTITLAVFANNEKPEREYTCTSLLAVFSARFCVVRVKPFTSNSLNHCHALLPIAVFLESVINFARSSQFILGLPIVEGFCNSPWTQFCNYDINLSAGFQIRMTHVFQQQAQMHHCSFPKILGMTPMNGSWECKNKPVKPILTTQTPILLTQDCTEAPVALLRSKQCLLLRQTFSVHGSTETQHRTFVQTVRSCRWHCTVCNVVWIWHHQYSPSLCSMWP